MDYWWDYIVDLYFVIIYTKPWLFITYIMKNEYQKTTR